MLFSLFSDCPFGRPQYQVFECEVRIFGEPVRIIGLMRSWIGGKTMMEGACWRCSKVTPPPPHPFYVFFPPQFPPRLTICSWFSCVCFSRRSCEVKFEVSETAFLQCNFFQLWPTARVTWTSCGLFWSRWLFFFWHDVCRTESTRRRFAFLVNFAPWPWFHFSTINSLRHTASNQCRTVQRSHRSFFSQCDDSSSNRCLPTWCFERAVKWLQFEMVSLAGSYRCVGQDVWGRNNGRKGKSPWGRAVFSAARLLTG